MCIFFILPQSNESNDTVGSLPKSMNLIDFGAHKPSGPGSVRVSVLEAFDPLLIEQSNAGEWFVFHSIIFFRCASQPCEVPYRTKSSSSFNMVYGIFHNLSKQSLVIV